MQQFGHALKNTRDEFDGFFENGRVGWRAEDADRSARPLTPEMQTVFEDVGSLDRAVHWKRIEPFHSLNWLSVSAEELASFAEQEPDPGADEIISRSEGGRRVVISHRVERDPLLRAQAVKLHGALCMVCGFDFEKAYGEWGSGFCEVHHLKPLGNGAEQRVTNPLFDLAVLCANCHRMIHRRRGVTLTIEELRGKLRFIPGPLTRGDFPAASQTASGWNQAS